MKAEKGGYTKYKNYRENIFLMSLFAFFESFSNLTSNGSLLNALVAKVLIIFDLMPCWLGQRLQLVVLNMPKTLLVALTKLSGYCELPYLVRSMCS